MMYDFSYHRPASIDEALEIFNQADDGIYLAGGHTLLPALKQRLAAPSDVIDLSGIDALSGISRSADGIFIGAMTCHDEVATSSLVAGEIPALATMASGIGDAQVRNRGTIGGSVANSDPAADYPAGVLALNASVQTHKREIAADDFFTGMFETALEADEIITGFRFPVPDRAAYIKYPNPASRYATVGVFVAIYNQTVRVAITGAAPSVFRWTAVEAALAEDLSEASVADFRPALDDMNSDLHASAEYRAHLCNVMTRRAVAAVAG